MSFFFLLQNQRTRRQNRSCLQGLVPVGGKKGWRKGGTHGRVNVVQIVCSHVCKCKTDTCWNCFRNGGRGIKENGGGGNSSLIHLIYCKCHSVPPLSPTIIRKKSINIIECLLTTKAEVILMKKADVVPVLMILTFLGRKWVLIDNKGKCHHCYKTEYIRHYISETKFYTEDWKRFSEDVTWALRVRGWVQITWVKADGLKVGEHFKRRD
jgi:hypothetical protein